MRFRTARLLIPFLLLLLFLGINAQQALAETPVVRAVLFYSQTCPHCHLVITEVINPLMEQYGEQLEVIGIDVSNEAGQILYQATISRFHITSERLGVPTLIVGEQVLVGSREIPDYFPGIVAAALQKNGIDWPDIPGLREALAASGYTSAKDSGNTGDVDPNQERANPDQTGEANTTIEEEMALVRPRWTDKFAQDPQGNTISIIVLFGMIASAVGVGHNFLTDRRVKYLDWPKWVMPVLVAIGMIVAVYLAYVEVVKATPVCGPVGHCETVQASQYAYLFGVLPIGVLGVAGYIAILIAWLIQQYGPTSLRKLSTLAVWGMAWFGVLFSIYLTFLEPFVIGATCMWCVTSAVIMTLILWASTNPALEIMRVDESEFEEEDDEIGQKETSQE